MADFNLITGIQLVAAVFGLAMAYTTYLDLRRRRFGAGSFALWGLIWLGLAVVSLAPQVFQPLSRPFHARLMDIVIVLGMLVFGTVIYRLYVDLRQLQRKLEEVVREDSLRDFHPQPRALDAKSTPPA